MSNALKSFCNAKGIRIQFSETNAHQHNGLPEIYNKIIMNMTCSLMFRAGVPCELFESAILHAVFLINRGVCSSTGFRTRFEMWRGYKPDLKYVRIYGCLAFIYDEKRKSKLDPRAFPCIMIGNTETGHVLYDPITRKIDKYRNVKFDESKLYKDFVVNDQIV